MGLFKIRQIANAGPDRDNFDLIDLLKDFKFHSQPLLLFFSSKCSKMAKDFSLCHLLLTTLLTERANVANQPRRLLASAAFAVLASISSSRLYAEACPSANVQD